MSKRTIAAADLFCGAGGTSTGLRTACETLGIKLRLIAVNHWEIAIQTHTRNHPEAEHFHSSLDAVDPVKLVKDGKLDLLVASPECIHHSRARGGKPINDQSRASAWRIVEWASKLEIRHLLIENVPEFRTWGPLIKVRKEVAFKIKFPLPPFEEWFVKMNRHGGTRGEWQALYRVVKQTGNEPRELKTKHLLTCWVPDPQRKGAIYLAFLEALRAQGYTVEDQVLNAADYGDPTSRERLFIQARLGRKRIVWPEATHAPAATLAASAPQTMSLFAAGPPRAPYRTAREIIDWSLESDSIFNRKTPLRPNTLRRIFRGLQKFCGLPFIVPNFGERVGQEPRTHSVERPLPAVTGHGAGGLVQAFLVGAGGPTYAGKPRSIDRPFGTVLTNDHSALVQAFLVKYYGGHDAQSVDQPLPAVCANYEHFGLCQCFIMVNRNNNVPCALDEPLPTLCTGNHMYLCQAFLSRFQGNHEGRADGAGRNYPVDEPLGALDTSNRFGLVESFIIPTNHGSDDRSHSLDKPMPTVTSVDAWALIESFLLSMEHGGSLHSLDQPLKTVTANGDAWGIAQPFLVRYNGTGGAASVNQPLPTVTARDRYGLVIPQLGALLDIRFRMLQPHELAGAMSFPKTYSFAGNREQRVKQIGNAVPVNTARALCHAILSI
jgi:DNA (cytosine-5)-methyltransferase 1